LSRTHTAIEYQERKVTMTSVVRIRTADHRHCLTLSILTVRLEPILIELEREKEDLLIIGHASVIRCLLAYLIGLPASEIPAIEIARGDLLEVVPTSYGVVSQAYHFWDGPGRIEEEEVEEEHEEVEVSAEGNERHVKTVRRVYRDANNFYENYAEDTRGKRIRPATEVSTEDGSAKPDTDTVDGVDVKDTELVKDPEASKPPPRDPDVCESG
jgi:hypothetical protein